MNRSKAFLDTNILLYSFARGNRREETARSLLAKGGEIGVQNLNEFANAARRKLGMSWAEVGAALQAIRTLCGTPVALTLEIHLKALEIAQNSGYGFYDSLVLATAMSAGCSVLYSEDMQHRQEIDGLTIHNPFRPD